MKLSSRASARSIRAGGGSDDDEESGPWGRVQIPQKVSLFVDNQLAQGLFEMFRLGEFCDVELSVAGEQFATHKVVVAISSPMLSKLFLTKPSHINSKGLPTYIIRDCDAETFASLLEFTYTGALEVSPPHLMKFLVAAHNLQFFALRDVLMAQLLGKGLLNQETCIEIWDIGQTLGFTELESMAEDYLRRHFTLLSRTQPWLELEASQIIRIISNDFLNVEPDGEAQVFEAVAKWIRFDIRAREKLIPQVFAHVRLPKSLQVVTQQVPQVTSDQDLSELAAYVRENLESASREEGSQFAPRTSGTEICTIGGISGNAEFSISIPFASIFDPRQGKWKDDSKVEVPACRYGEGIARLENCVYKVGGFTANGVFGQVEVFDMLNNTWGAAPPLPNPRAYAAVACSNGYVFAVGGMDHSYQVVGDVERFDPVHNIWESFDPLETPVMACSAMELHGSLYIVGGSNDVSGNKASRRTMFRFDMENDLWEEMSSMRNARCKFALACLHGMMYAIGGWDKNGHPLKSVEIYDPERDVWTEGPELQVARANFAAVTLDSMIIVLGGTGTDGFAMSSVEKFEFKTQRWTRGPEMPTARQSFIATTWDVNYIFHMPVTVNPNPDDCKNVLDMSQKLRLQRKLSQVETLVTPRGTTTGGGKRAARNAD
eukprot:c226_g1_i1.p1 GENE.c226_g1_i1~~c226_g1_i1.p1  ORF type:complete len:659 (-),score=152.77 c226_g1_i1:475-2451(-)